jgi:hypothetical protein
MLLYDMVSALTADATKVISPFISSTVRSIFHTIELLSSPSVMCVLDNLMNFHFSPPGIWSRSCDHGTEEVNTLSIQRLFQLTQLRGCALVTFHFSAPVFVLHGIPSFPRTVLRRRGKLHPYVQIPNSTVSAYLSLRFYLTFDLPVSMPFGMVPLNICSSGFY